MVYEEYAPPDSLRRTVAAFWRFELDASDPDSLEHTVPPDGTIGLAVALSSTSVQKIAIVGPRISALRVPVHRDARYVGVRFRPGAAGPLFGRTGASLRDRVELLHDVAADKATAMAAPLEGRADPGRVIERLAALVLSWQDAAPPGDAAVARMVDGIMQARGGVRVQSLAAAAGVGYRQALRRFQEHVGLSPKELARLVRVRWACLHALERTEPSWTTVSADTGFADHSHLAREFSEVFGWPPGLVRAYLRRIEHVRVTP